MQTNKNNRRAEEICEGQSDRELEGAESLHSALSPSVCMAAVLPFRFTLYPNMGNIKVTSSHFHTFRVSVYYSATLFRVLAQHQ